MKNLLKKLSVIAIFSFAFIFVTNYVMADEKEDIEKDLSINELESNNVSSLENPEDMMDSKAINGVYKLSDDKHLSYLPMLRYATDRIELDKETGKVLGSFFSNSSIEVSKKQEGIKCLFSNDTTRINASMDYPIVFATQNVIIDSTIENSIIVFGGATVTFTENSEVKGDIICFATDLELNGKVHGSVIGYTDKVNIKGSVLKDLRIECNELNIETKDNIKGNVLVLTYNKEFSEISEKYPNALIKIIEQKTKLSKTDILKDIAKGFIVCLVFAIIYVLINKNNSSFIDKTIKIAKEHVMFILLSGSLSLLLFPFVVLILIIIAMLNFEFVAIPLLVLYLAFLIISGMLSTFTVGSLIIKYISDRYLTKESKGMKIGFCFLTYVVLYTLARIPIIGSYVTWGLVLLANGVVLARIFNFKEKNK